MTTTKAQLAEQLASLRQQIDPLELALTDAIEGKVTWFGRGDYRIGISRPTGAAGGIAIIHANGMARAVYWERFASGEHSHFSVLLSGDMERDVQQEILRRRDVIEAAQQFVRNAQKAA